MIGLEATIEGERQISVRLGVAADGVRDWQEPLEKVNSLMLRTFDMNFDARGGLFGGWPPRKKAYPWPLLEKTGRMRSAFTSSVSSTEAIFGNPTPYFKYHQSNQPRTKLPRRVMMMIDQERRNTIIRIFQEYIVKIMRG